jgi:hypothetical protein
MVIKAEIAKKNNYVRDVSTLLLYAHKMEETAEYWILHNEEFCYLHKSQSTVRIGKSKMVQTTLGKSSSGRP